MARMVPVLTSKILSVFSPARKVETVVNGSWTIVKRQLQSLAGPGALVCPSLAPRVTRGPSVARLSSSNTSSRDDRVSVTFTDRDGDSHTVRARLGDTLLEVAREYDIDLEGACDGTLSCSTCHLVVHPEWFPMITDPLTEEEEDMLDLAYGLTDTSRLGCQIVVTEDLDGLKLTIPMGTIDARET